MNISELIKILSDFILGIIVLDKNEKVVYVNDYVKRTMPNEILGKTSFYNLFGFFAKDIVGKTKKYRSPSQITYSFKGYKIFIENIPMILISIKPNQSMENTEIELFCLRKIIDSIDEGIIMSDYEGKLVIYNKAQEKLEGVIAKDMIGKYIWDAYKYGLKDKSEHREVYKSGKAIVNKYEAHAYSNGIPKFVSYSTYPVTKAGERVAVYSISKNESKLQALLAETIDLKRKFIKKEDNQLENGTLSNGTNYTFSDIIGNSKIMKDIISEAQSIALLNSNLLIVGDTGTGKEIFAQSIHNFGKKRIEPFIGINCAAIPETLLESILFGSVKGAYTGAINRSGLFEDAKEGTLFLDELNSMPISMQSKLLRVLQERKILRVGGAHTINIKCRIICAVNKEPQNLIREGKLRQDLFYRIANLVLYVPTLHDRGKDIIELSNYFIKKCNRIMGKCVSSMSKDLQEKMFLYNWPGNIRELEYFIENLMVRVNKSQKELTVQDIPAHLNKAMLGTNLLKSKNDTFGSLTCILNRIERNMILYSLKKNKWNVSKTSKDLGIIRQSLIYRIKKLGIVNEENE